MRKSNLQGSLVGALLFACALLASCRDGEEQTLSNDLVPSGAGANGCSGPDQTFAPPQTASAVALGVLAIGPLSQVTAAGDAELLFATGANATVVQIDVSGAPVETELVSAGTVAALLATAGIASAPELSGIAVLDATALLVVEHTSNSLLRVDRAAPETVTFFAGEPNETPGFADGIVLPLTGAGAARFAFLLPAQIAPTGNATATVLVADPGNHALRAVSQGFVTTLSGTGSAFFADGELAGAGFDTPSGLSVTCGGRLLVSESGAEGVGGQRLRELALGVPNFFGPTGTVTTLAGDGTNATAQGDGAAASLAAPVSPLATSEGDVYFVDSTTGVLRRMSGASDTVDCPLWPDCASALVAGGDFTPGGVLSLTQTPAGVLYVLDASAGTLLRVTP